MYDIYIKEINNIIYNKNNYDERIMFGEKGHRIGIEIYRKAGYKGMCDFMSILSCELKRNPHPEQYFNALKELKYSFNGICEEWLI